ncbi:MAG: hypothetical protein JW814_06000 [Candidatus Krumholzibacteriota bacterium]|nr:hypothetical protein [Candidatus Krumholzibacteriota bacterium]
MNIYERKTESFLILTCVVLLLFASLELGAAGLGQGGKAERRLFRLHYENTSGENGVSTYGYDAAGNIDYGVWELLDGSRFSINYYTCNSNGDVEKKYREFSEGRTSLTEYNYDGAGNLVSEVFERSDSVSGVTYYEYDKAGRRVKADCRGLNGWFHGLLYYTIDESGQTTGADILREGKKIGSIIYEYDEHGDLAMEEWDFDGTWKQTFIYEYGTYRNDDSTRYTSANPFLSRSGGHRLSGEKYDYSGEIGGPSFFEYDDKGKLVRKIFKRSDGFSTETFYIHDSEGRLTRSFRKYSNGLSANFAYEYDGDRKLLKRSFHRSDGRSGSESYHYDKEGVLVSAEYINFDLWLTGEIEFSHREDGRLETGLFKGKDGMGADISFSWDENGNLEQIDWLLSSGKNQSYTFEYEKIR